MIDGLHEDHVGTFFLENAGELRFIALEREKRSPYNSLLSYGDIMSALNSPERDKSDISVRRPRVSPIC